MPLRDQSEQPGDGLATMQKLVESYFGKSRRVIMPTKEQLESILGSETGNRRDLIKSVAAKMDCNGVLIFTLERYRQRVGSTMSATDPASLAFNFRLFKAPEGKLLCSGRYDETQQSLSENILDFSQARKRGFKWISVEEMADKAITDRFDRCQDLKDRSATR